MEKKIYLKFYPNNTRPNNKGELPVYLRITADRKKVEVATGVSCKLDLWNEEIQRINSKPLLNKSIEKMSLDLDRIIKRLQVEDKEITAGL